MIFFSFLKNNKAAAAVYFALVLPVLLAVLALSLDMGVIIFKRQDLQKMADIAAVAAFSEKQSGGDSEMQRLAACDVINLSGSSCEIYDVEVNSPPNSGNFAGNNSYVEATVSSTVPSFFASIFFQGQNFLSERAVVGGGSPTPVGQCCLCSLNKSDSVSTEVKGTATLNLDSCGIATNSSSPDALKLSGNINVTASCIYSYGTPLDSSDLPSGVTLESCNEPVQIDEYIVDPYENAVLELKDEIEALLQSENCTAANLDLVETHKCSAPECGQIGLACTAFKASNGTNNLNFTKDELHVPPGLFLLDGVNLQMTSKEVLTGTDVVFLFTNGGSLSIVGGQLGTTTEPLTARSEAPFKGILFGEVGQNDVSHFFGGNETSSFSGALYFPTGEINISGTSEGDQTSCAQFISNTLTVSGKATVAIDNCETGEGGILESLEVQKSGGQKLVE